MRIIFCSEPFATPVRVDSLYEDEAEAARAAGFDTSLVNFESLTDDLDAVQATRRVAAASPPEDAIYRGWMLRPERYEALYDALLAKGVRLINAPAEYRHAHYLPESYEAIAEMTARSVWLPPDGDLDTNLLWPLLAEFGDGPMVVKDYVKSQKHHWDEACFIPSASDRPAVERISSRFLELTGPALNEGLVYREFVELEPLSQHSRSGMPLTKEFRLFVLDGHVLASAEYWEEGDYGETVLPLASFEGVAAGVRSRFFTMDIARRKDGEWMIVELGDGQVAGLPDRADVSAFYAALATALNS